MAGKEVGKRYAFGSRVTFQGRSWEKTSGEYSSMVYGADFKHLDINAMPAEDT